MLLPVVSKEERVVQSGTMKLHFGGSLSDFTSVLLPLGYVCALTGSLPDSKNWIFFFIIHLKIPSAGLGTWPAR